jgi:peptidoglycan/LPS O-acetylase OafA/YrhL
MSTTLAPQVSVSKAMSIDRFESSRFYRPELDALRFLAFMLVFCRHVISAFGLVKKHQAILGAPLPGATYVAPKIPLPTYHVAHTWEVIQNLAQACDFGVCLFFFLSSFLITRLLLIERESTGRVAVKDFYIRRSLRIWPLYFAFLGLVTLLSVWVPSIRSTESRVLASLIFIANWPIVLHGFAGTPIEPLWSISVEEQFYLVWPGFARLGRRGIIGVSILLVVVPVCTLIYFGQHNGTINSNLWPNSAVQCLFFAGGALTAVFGTPENLNLSLLKRTATLLGGFACWMAASGACHVVRAESPGAFKLVTGYLLVVLGTFLIFTAFAGAPRSIFPKAILYLGKISYGLYVFHVLSLALTMKVMFALFAHGRTLSTAALSGVIISAAAVALIVTILCAMASYHFLEKPFLRLKKRFTLVRSRPA